MANKGLGLTSPVADGSTEVAHYLDTANALTSSAQLFAWRNNGTDKFILGSSGDVRTGIWQGTAVGVVYGGTGLATVAAGDLLYASAADTLARLAKGTARQLLQMNAGATAPEWASNIDIPGTLDVTGVTTFDASVFINDTSNANVTTGLTINQGPADDQILAFKSSDVATSLTTVTNRLTVETDDFAVFGKQSSGSGGLVIQSMMEDGVTDSALAFEVYGSDAQTTDTTSSIGMVNFLIAEHNGANALSNIAANGNAFAVRVYTGGVFTTQLILKGDDGELHLGNTTLVALDDFDDRALVQTMRREVSTGLTEDWPFPVPVYDRAVLERIGVLGPRDERGRSLFAIQPRFAMCEGAIYQNYMQLCALDEAQTATWERVSTLEARVAHLEAA